MCTAKTDFIVFCLENYLEIRIGKPHGSARINTSGRYTAQISCKKTPAKEPLLNINSTRANLDRFPRLGLLASRNFRRYAYHGVLLERLEVVQLVFISEVLRFVLENSLEGK